MNNSERYKKAFSSLHTSKNFTVRLEDEKMKGKVNGFRNVLVAACTVIVLLLGTAGAYAADLGGIQRTIQVWIHGDQTEAVLNIDGSKGEYTVRTKDGNRVRGGGGVAFDRFGKERALTAEELAEYIVNEVSEETVNGRRLLYYRDQKVDITDLFKDKDYCFVKITDGRNTVYVTAIKDGGLGCSSKRFMQPFEFSTK